MIKHTNYGPRITLGVIMLLIISLLVFIGGIYIWKSTYHGTSPDGTMMGNVLDWISAAIFGQLSIAFFIVSFLIFLMALYLCIMGYDSVIDDKCFTMTQRLSSYKYVVAIDLKNINEILIDDTNGGSLTILSSERKPISYGIGVSLTECRWLAHKLKAANPNIIIYDHN